MGYDPIVTKKGSYPIFCDPRLGSYPIFVLKLTKRVQQSTFDGGRQCLELRFDH